MLIAFSLLFMCAIFIFSLSFVMPLSYGRYWEALYVEEDENERMLIFISILMLLLGVVQFCCLILVLYLILHCFLFLTNVF